MFNVPNFMIPYSRQSEQTIPPSSVKIIGLGGAGANMLEHIALDGMEGTELLALNTDLRTLSSCIAKEKIQLGVNLTRGLGSGGDPELGLKAVLEAETEIRASLSGRRIVFVCVGLGGGTGSGAAPIVTRIAREEGAFVVVFATIPFAFEGKRRRDQAETALNELAVLSNALVTFDNNRMGELVLAKQGIHEAFVAADHMISESIKAVIRLVVRPGLINVGLDDLMSALRTNRSRCLFGSGLANGKDRATKALRNALASPLLDQGSLLKEAQTVLVHLCGGEDLTLFEVELLMQRLQKFVPESAQVLFGAAVDPAMGDNVSLTLISSLPEESLAMAPRDSISQADSDSPLLARKPEPTPVAPAQVAPAPVVPAPVPAPAPEPVAAVVAPAPPPAAKPTTLMPSLFDIEPPFAETSAPPKVETPIIEEEPEPIDSPFSLHDDADDVVEDESPDVEFEFPKKLPVESPPAISISEFNTTAQDSYEEEITPVAATSDEEEEDAPQPLRFSSIKEPIFADEPPELPPVVPSYPSEPAAADEHIASHEAPRLKLAAASKAKTRMSSKAKISICRHSFARRNKHSVVSGQALRTKCGSK
jgi:cell division protein FtsZ